jgi:hypothetical protein
MLFAPRRWEATIYASRPTSALAVAKPQQNGYLRAPSDASASRSDIHPMRRRGAKSFVDDLGLSRGVVISRAAASLRSIETKPFDSEICPLWMGTSPLVFSFFLKDVILCERISFFLGLLSLQTPPPSPRCMGCVIFILFSI